VNKWIEEGVSHVRKVGIFEMLVWPLEASPPKYPYAAWTRIPRAGDFDGLPSSHKAKVKFESLAEAKTWIENETRGMCLKVLQDMTEAA
jgi:hypothetical protein